MKLGVTNAAVSPRSWHVFVMGQARAFVESLDSEWFIDLPPDERLRHLVSGSQVLRDLVNATDVYEASVASGRAEVPGLFRRLWWFFFGRG